jgi:esterase/lipase
LSLDHTFDHIRLENPIEVYANEVAPLSAVDDAVGAALAEGTHLSSRARAEFAFADELQMLDWDKHLYSKEKHREINARETATESPAPFLLLPAAARPLGILLVHGFLAAPGETRPFGTALQAAGYPVLGVRLKGHGTSPWDLRERAWEDWLESVQRGYEILRAYCEQVCVVGFSTGGALTLIHAAAAPLKLAGIVAIAPPMKFRNRNMRFVPLVHGANQILEWVSRQEGVLPFRPTDTEHPQINYRNMPIRGLYELTRMVTTLKKSLSSITCPTLVIQGTEDHVVEPAGAELIMEKLTTVDKRLAWVTSKRHGILFENVGETHQLVRDFLTRLENIRRRAP